jgi:hypothetical protein
MNKQKKAVTEYKIVTLYTTKNPASTKVPALVTHGLPKEYDVSVPTISRKPPTGSSVQTSLVNQHNPIMVTPSKLPHHLVPPKYPKISLQMTIGRINNLVPRILILLKLWH